MMCCPWVPQRQQAHLTPGCPCLTWPRLLQASAKSSQHGCSLNAHQPSQNLRTTPWLSPRVRAQSENARRQARLMKQPPLCLHQLLVCRPGVGLDARALIHHKTVLHPLFCLVAQRYLPDPGQPSSSLLLMLGQLTSLCRVVQMH